MVTPNEYSFVMSASVDQQIKRALGIWTAIDIIAKKNLNEALTADTRDVVVDPPERFFEQINTAVYVADRIDTHPRRHTCAFLSFSYPPSEHDFPM